MTFFEQKFLKNSYGYEIGKISSALATILLSQTRIVTLSKDTLKKNLSHHPDLHENDYLLLGEIVGKSHFVAKDGDRTVAIMLHKDSKELYHYALKSTTTGKQLFLTSFRKTRQKSINRLRKKAREKKIIILKDNLP